MKTKYYFVLFIGITPRIWLSAQTFRGILLNEEDNQPVPQASITNLNNKASTYSNAFGRFELSVSKNDSLEIQHLSFNTTRILPEDSEIYLKPQVRSLQEVAVISKKKRSKFIQYNKKTDANHGMSMNGEYAFFIENPDGMDIDIKEVEIPVKMRDEYSSEGLLLLRLYHVDEHKRLTNWPISELFELDVATLIGKKNMNFKLSKPVAFPREGFYLVLKRIVPIEIFKNRKKAFDKSFAVNPWIPIKYVEEGTNMSMSFERSFSDSDWLETSMRFVRPISIRLKIYFR